MGKKLYFYYGVMNSSKTLNLLATAYNFEEKGIPFMALKPSMDTRDGTSIIRTRAGLSRECVSVERDTDIYEAVKNYNSVLISRYSRGLEWILVDECQFLTEEQVDQLADIVDNMDINVICYGLRTDFQSKSFPASKRLFEIADELHEFKSSCECGRKASINARFDENGKIISEGSQFLIGGNELYKPICRKCWRKKIKEEKE